MESEGSNSSGEDETHNRVPKYNQIFGQGYLYDVVRLGDLGKSESSTNLNELAENVMAAEADNQPMGFFNNESTVNQPALDTSLNLESSRAEGDLYDIVRNHLGDLGKPRSSMILDELPENVSVAEAKKKTFDEVCQDIQQGEINLDWTFNLGEMISSNPMLGGVGHMALPQQNQWMQYHIPTIHPRQQQDMLPPGHRVQQPILGVENVMLDRIMASFLMGSLSDTQNQESSARARARRQQRTILIKETRSQARKEAYLQELESKLSRLKLENERLKRMKEAEMLLPSKPAPEPRYQLRRTSSSPI
ncbi:unnamed protein product [Fraxinus pennsylvanica]|uniref:BZIP domain-containing protein n=1 Tax=Fraxinus pennsylvanica TaxID=56036 RepID=A0AAD2AG19_9LAMI|nr:unnamed protein product [Fraxinus pennsylvanica]